MKHHRKLTLLSALGLLGLAAGSQAATLTITGCESLSLVDATTMTFACSVAPSVVGAPSGCTVSPPSVAFDAKGGTVNAPTVSCTSGNITAPAWTRNAATVTFPVALPANTTSSQAVYSYSGLVCDVSGSPCSTVAYRATVDAGSNPPPTSASCGNLKVITAHLDTDPNNKVMTFTGQRYVTEGFASTDTIAVAEIRVPDGISGLTTLSVYQYGSDATPRKAYLSRTMCDTSATGKPYLIRALGPVMNVQVDGNPVSGYVYMKPGETWYVNVKNEQLLSTATSCKSGACDIGIKLYKP